MNKVICQAWTEHEAGWGSRPDGYTLHLTEEHRKEFTDDYLKRQDDLSPGSGTPAEYSVPETPFIADVDDIVFKKLKDNFETQGVKGMWSTDNKTPPKAVITPTYEDS